MKNNQKIEQYVLSQSSVHISRYSETIKSGSIPLVVMLDDEDVEDFEIRQHKIQGLGKKEKENLKLHEPLYTKNGFSLFYRRSYLSEKYRKNIYTVKETALKFLFDNKIIEINSFKDKSHNLKNIVSINCSKYNLNENYITFDSPINPHLNRILSGETVSFTSLYEEVIPSKTKRLHR